MDKRSRDVTPWILLGGSWEIFVDAVLCALIRPGDTFVDAGANMGYYTVKVGSRVGPQGRVFAFEANPEMFAFLRENVSINGMAGYAQPVNEALGAEPGHLVLHHDPAYPGGGTVLLPHEAPSLGLAARSVPVTTLADALPADARIDLIKIDVEGFEVPVLRGMARILARSPNAAIVVEVSTALWSRFGDPADLLRDFADDRRMFRIHYDGRLEEMDGGALSGLDPTFVSYMLLLPNTPERAAQIAPLLSPPAAAAVAPVDPPAPRPSIWRRVARRLLRR